MMIAVSRLMRLPIGRVYTPRGWHGGRVRRKTVLEHPQHGEYTGPFFVRREVTFDEYCRWFHEETGEIVTMYDRHHNLNPSRWRFYEISLD
jgi:hypothetical protein